MLSLKLDHNSLSKITQLQGLFDTGFPDMSVGRKLSDYIEKDFSDWETRQNDPRRANNPILHETVWSIDCKRTGHMREITIRSPAPQLEYLYYGNSRTGIIVTKGTRQLMKGIADFKWNSFSKDEEKRLRKYVTRIRQKEHVRVYGGKPKTLRGYTDLNVSEKADYVSLMTRMRDKQTESVNKNRNKKLMGYMVFYSDLKHRWMKRKSVRSIGPRVILFFRDIVNEAIIDGIMEEADKIT